VKEPIVSFSDFSEERPIADRAAIQELNPHRYEFALLDAILFEDASTGRCVGYFDLAPDAFWVRGHFPEFPLMPGVLICESAAQLSSYFALRTKMLEGAIVALGGLDEIRFRGAVKPGDRLVTMLQRDRVRKNVMFTGRFQCYVKQELVCDGVIRGVAIKPD
jgi:3-hydroxyacyl-[acyl-carrier-protein] dehydratase